MTPLGERLTSIDNKLGSIDEKVDELSESLAVHKAKTSKLSLVLGGLASLLVAVAAVLLKGCG